MNSRKVALNILFEVLKKNKFSNKLLNNLTSKKAMTKKDIAFIYKLVYGTLQYKIYLEYVVNKVINPNKTNYKIQIILWMSLYQLRFLNSKPYYVINEAVEIAKNVNKNASNFVNKILQTLFKNTKLGDVYIKNKQNIYPLKNAFPYWLFKYIEKNYSKSDAIKFVEHVNKENWFSIRLNTLKIKANEFEKKYQQKYELQKSLLVENFYLTCKNILNKEIFEKGYVTVQDQTSGYASWILNPSLNSHILDMCCAPGGKLTHLAQIVNNTGLIDAYEINKTKIKLVQENILRLNVKNVNLVCKNALNIEEKKYDYILLDAPCSGFGVIRQKPEIKLKKIFTKDYQNLLDLQEKLLQKAYKCMKKNSILLYCTCTIFKEENQYQIEKFLNSHSDLLKITEKIFLGFEFNSDGFYICKILKK